MQIMVGAGTYVVAVSGGVDSIVLLDLLRKRPGLKLIVAHFDHGIRDDSETDRKLVQTMAKSYNLSFVHERGRLGPNTSEAVARKARYKFLQSVMGASNSKGIITAHHQDDLLETAVLNMLRGSGRMGMTSLKSSEKLIRPLLPYSKEQIIEYAKLHNLTWREDPSNNDTKFMRNYIRHNIIPKFSPGQRAQLLILLEGMHAINYELDNQITNLLHLQPDVNKLDKNWFVHLPHDVAREIVHTWLRRHAVRNLTRRTVERLIVAMKTGKPGQSLDIDQEHVLKIHKTFLELATRRPTLSRPLRV